MHVSRLLGLAAALTVVYACAETPTEAPQTPDAANLVAAADPGGGATITRFPFNGANTGSVDAARGLFAIHYVNTPAAQAAWEGQGVLDPTCQLPVAPATISLKVLDTPSGTVHTMGSGEVHVVVFNFDGNPASLPLTCAALIAEGRVDLRASFTNVPFPPGPGPAGPGATHIQFKSHGTINDVQNGGTVRLNWTFQFSIPPSGKDKTNIMLH